MEHDERDGARRRAHRLTAVLAGATAVVALGTAGALAAGDTRWVPWATDDGATCRMRFTVQPADPTDRAASSSTGSSASPTPLLSPAQQQAVDEATAFLADLDYASIDEAGAIARWQAVERRAAAVQTDGEEPLPALTGDDLALTAVGNQVWRELAAHLAEEEIPSELVVFSQGWQCD